MTPAAVDALHVVFDAAELLAENGLHRDATRLRYHARALYAELLVERSADTALTDEQIAALMFSAFPRTKCSPAYLAFARRIERASRGTS